MIVTIEFDDGRTREFNMSTFCASDPWSRPREGSQVVTTELDLRCDLLMRNPADDTQGIGYGSLRVDVIRHELSRECATVPLDGYVDASGGLPEIPAPLRIPSCSVLLASAEEMERASIVYVSSGGQHKPVAWRQGTNNWIINGVKFEAARRLFYTDAMMTSTNDQAIRLFRDLMAGNPDANEEVVANMLGYPVDAIREVIENRAGAEQADEEQDDDLGVDDDRAPLVDVSREPHDDDEEDDAE